MTCPYCEYAAKFHSYQQRRVLTAHGELRLQRAYYYCGRCHQSFIPYDDVLGLVDDISPGLMPLVCLAGTLVPFVDAAEDVLRGCSKSLRQPGGRHNRIAQLGYLRRDGGASNESWQA